MHIAITGATGLVGSRLVAFLESKGDRISRIVRSYSKENSAGIQWGLESGESMSSFQGEIDAVVHLAGENISTGRWTNAKKQRIRESRVEGTKSLCESIVKSGKIPKIFICASAIGFYGNRGDELLNEDSCKGSGFLSDVCEDWEKAANSVSGSDVRVVNTRFGVIFSPSGGALAKMLIPFKMGAGGRIGDGRQYMSWVSIDDVAGAIYHSIITGSIHGPVNVVAPGSVTNSKFTKTLGGVLGRPTIFPLPGFVARLALGEMANELLLSSARVEPAKLINSGYKFQYPALKEALSYLLL